VVLSDRSNFTVEAGRNNRRATVQGTIVMGGVLSVYFGAGNEPESGHSYDIFGFSRATGNFSRVVAINAGREQSVKAQYSDGLMRVSVVHRESTDNSDLGTGAIVGISIIAAGVVILAIIGTVWLLRERRRRQRKREHHKSRKTRRGTRRYTRVTTRNHDNDDNNSDDNSDASTAIFPEAATKTYNSFQHDDE
jgi:hypothetical protein